MYTLCLQNILDGSVTTHPTECESDFPAIVECMAAGRNHVPCCEKALVPDVCQDMCVGTYTVQARDLILTKKLTTNDDAIHICDIGRSCKI